jgi:hypothetical protein
MNNKILFSIYTNKSGHQVMGFDAFDTTGRSCFDQAIDYAVTTFNDPNDKPRVFQLTLIPYNENTIKRTVAEWEAVTGIEIVDCDGWRHDSTSLLYPITESEFRVRANKSTIRPHCRTRLD